MKIQTRRQTASKLMITCVILSFLAVGCTQEEEVILNSTIQSVSSAIGDYVSISNAGFDSGSKSPWTETSDFALSSSTHSGSGSAKVTAAGNRVEQTVSVHANTDYELKAYIKGEGRIGAGSGTSSLVSSSSFTAVTYSFNSGSSTSMTIFGEADASNCRFDTFTLQETGSSTSGDPIPLGNLAYEKTTTQSSLAYEGEASRAVDGNTSGNWNDGSITHTDYEANPWWQVDLGSTESIGEIILWNRTNCCSSRLTNFTVSVINSSGSTTFSKSYNSTPSPSLIVDAGGAEGSIIKVQLDDTERLSLAEVQVFEYSGSTANPVVDTGDNFEWQNWYLSVPIDRGTGKATSIYYEEIENDDLTSEEEVYFSKNSDGSYGLYTEFTGYTTSGEYSTGTSGKFCRTELREYWQGNQTTSDNWSMNGTGTHILESTLKVQSCGGSGETYVAQIHGISSDDTGTTGSPATVKVRWDNGDLELEYYISPSDPDDQWTSATGQVIKPFIGTVDNEKFTIKLKVINGVLQYSLYCSAKGIDTGYITAYDYDANGYKYDNYFKTGNYFRYNGDYNESSLVTLYKVVTEHY